MIQTKCIFAPAEHYDGTRVLIISHQALGEHYNNNRLKKRIAKKMYDVHCTNLVPQQQLVDAFVNNKLTFLQFEQCKQQCIEYLRKTVAIQETLRGIAQYALTSNITFLCTDARPMKCYRFIFAQECARYESNIYHMAR